MRPTAVMFVSRSYSDNIEVFQKPILVRGRNKLIALHPWNLSPKVAMTASCACVVRVHSAFL